MTCETTVATMCTVIAPAKADELQGSMLDQVKDSWARATPSWCTFVRDQHDIHRERVHGPALLEACGDVRGRRVLDLGCGEGWCSRALGERGATVVGIDVCESMIEAALAHPLQPHWPIDYRVMDACHVDRHQWPQPFDLIAACMSLHDMPDPGQALKAARRVLAPDGLLVCSVPHPMTHMLHGRECIRRQDGILYIRADRYFEGGSYTVPWHVPQAGEGWKTIRWTRTLGEYTTLLRKAGFVIRDQIEPQATDDHERLQIAAQLPYYLVIVAAPASPPPPD